MTEDLKTGGLAVGDLKTGTGLKETTETTGIAVTDKLS